MSDYLLVGLGNPGKEYETTRHNFGFLAATHFAQRHGIKLVRSAKYRSLIGDGVVEGLRVYVLLPMTFMNLSGTAVRDFLKYKEIVLSSTLVLCDDFHLAFGDIRIRPKGSAGGHNGLSSVIKECHSDEIPRLRLGVGAPQDKDKVVDYVLSPFKGSEKKQIEDVAARAADCCEIFFTSGINKAMDGFNKKSNKEE